MLFAEFNLRVWVSKVLTLAIQAYHQNYSQSVATFQSCGDARLQRAQDHIKARLLEQNWQIMYSQQSPGARITQDHANELAFVKSAFDPAVTFILDHTDCGRLRMRPDSEEHPIPLEDELTITNKKAYLEQVEQGGCDYNGDECVKHNALDTRETLGNLGFLPVNLIVDLTNHVFKLWSPNKKEWLDPSVVAEEVEKNGADIVDEYGIEPIAIYATQGRIMLFAESAKIIDAKLGGQA
jgi:hypothetical protein